MNTKTSALVKAAHSAILAEARAAASTNRSAEAQRLNVLALRLQALVLEYRRGAPQK